MVTKENLIAFEDDIANYFNDGNIRAPIHLYHGNEDKLIKIFGHIQTNDWVCCTWRNHYQCLLKGVPPSELKSRILSGKSMVMCIKEYNILCSSIVGGIPSIASGIAWGIKQKNLPNKVWCFVGDMSAATGAFDEAYRYSMANNLPIVFVIEDNGRSVETPTFQVWGDMHPAYVNSNLSRGEDYHEDFKNKIIYYKYENKKYPHAGAGMRVQF